MDELLWGIDLGGSKIEGIVIDASSRPKVLSRLRIHTEATKGYAHILNRIEEVVKLLKEETGHVPTKIGIGTPGVLDPDSRTMKNCNTTVLNGRPLQKDLAQRFGIPITMANDANCLALAEALMGVVADEHPKAKVVFGVIMGTGVGGGLVINGQLHIGLQGIAGEWGHNVIEPHGKVCYCGKQGCIETVISGPALELYYEQQCGHPLPLKEIVRKYNEGSDAHAQRTIARLFEYFGKGMAQVINVVDPDAIVIGGGLGNIKSLYNTGKEAIERYVFNTTRLKTPILKPKLGDSAGVFGAAFLCRDQPTDDYDSLLAR